MPKQNSTNTQSNLEVDVHLAEFEKLREEVMYHIKNQHQTMLISLGSVSVILPILMNQTSTLPLNVLAVVFYLLSITYSILAMNFAKSRYAISVISVYTYFHLMPRINQAIFNKQENYVLQWEAFIRKERMNFLAAVMAVIGPLGSLIIILLPGSLSIISAQYVLLIPATQIPQPTLALQFISAWLLPLSILSWAFFVTAIAVQVLGVAYTTFRNQWATK